MSFYNILYLLYIYLFITSVYKKKKILKNLFQPIQWPWLLSFKNTNTLWVHLIYIVHILFMKENTSLLVL